MDCDQAILGPAVLVTDADSMSGARAGVYAHPPNSPECVPRTPGKAKLRRLIDGGVGPEPAGAG
ncbi:hypothetical protein ACFYPN_08945 [Streptomyces sp. NPDC005576]|uniref:hypothetical protein n=1 Tax=unclassified Streptomyces TaxID=2593676 RepID=UPI0033BFF154